MLQVTVNLDYGADHRGCSSVVERQLPKLNVVGSIPITRSTQHRLTTQLDRSSATGRGAGWGIHVVAGGKISES
jgi:hypothetical protein